MLFLEVLVLLLHDFLQFLVLLLQALHHFLVAVELAEALLHRQKGFRPQLLDLVVQLPGFFLPLLDFLQQRLHKPTTTK